MYRSSPWRTTQMGTGLRSVPSGRWVASRSSSAFAILSSSSLVQVVTACPFKQRWWQVSRSQARHPLEVLGVTGPVHLDLRGGSLDLAEVGGGELDADGADGLLYPLEPAGAGDRDAPRLAG